MFDPYAGSFPDSSGQADTWVAHNPTAEDILAQILGETGAPSEENQSAAPEPLTPIEPILEAEAEAPALKCDAPSASTEDAPENPSAVQLNFERVEQDIRALADSSAKISAEVREMHKLYHNEYASRLKSMQDELERYREVDKGRIFDDILGEVAKLHSNNEAVQEDIADEKLRKRIRYLFEDIAYLLEANGVVKQKSKPGDKRNTRHCQVRERLDTNDPELHDTVAYSHGTGFFVENRTLVKEPVDIYLYTASNDDKLNEN